MTRSQSANPWLAAKPPLLIIGAHRSGTSATARALELLGLQLGQRLDSHRESKAMQQLHEKYLRRVGAAWHNPKPFLDSIGKPEGEKDCLDYLRSQVGEDFASILGYRWDLKGWWLRRRLKRDANWGWKEPRTTLFAPLWLQIFPEARVLDVVRHPVAVALSMRQRDRKFQAAGDSPTPGLEDLHYCLRLALTYVEAGARVASCTRNYRRIRFESLQENPASMLNELATFCEIDTDAGQIRQAAETIRPLAKHSWPDLTAEDRQQLARNEAAVTALGYEMPSPQRIPGGK